MSKPTSLKNASEIINTYLRPTCLKTGFKLVDPFVLYLIMCRQAIQPLHAHTETAVYHRHINLELVNHMVIKNLVISIFYPHILVSFCCFTRLSLYDWGDMMYEKARAYTFTYSSDR